MAPTLAVLGLLLQAPGMRSCGDMIENFEFDFFENLRKRPGQLG